jgi:hypothetical protein
VIVAVDEGQELPLLLVVGHDVGEEVVGLLALLRRGSRRTIVWGYAGNGTMYLREVGPWQR